MVELIVFNEQYAQEINDTLHNELGLDIRAFITMFNNGIINRRNDLVQKIAEASAEAYLNIELRTGNEIIVLSQAEASADQLIQRAEVYHSLLRVKRILEGIDASEYTQFFLDDKGKVCYQERDHETEEVSTVVVSNEVALPKPVKKELAPLIFGIDLDKPFTKSEIIHLEKLNNVIHANEQLA